MGTADEWVDRELVALFEPATTTHLPCLSSRSGRYRVEHRMREIDSDPDTDTDPDMFSLDAAERGKRMA